MKYVIGIIFLSIVLFQNVFAQSETEKVPEYSPVQNYDFNFKVKIIEGKVLSTWDTYADTENLKFYKFVYSKTNPNLSHPDDSSEYISNQGFASVHSQYLEEGTYYVRLCAITQQNDRFCSSVKKIAILNTKGVSEKIKLDFQNKAAATDVEKKAIIKKKPIDITTEKGGFSNKNSTSKNKLSFKMKKRIESVVNKFILKLEKKGLTDKKINQIIDKILLKAKVIKVKAKVKPILEYLIIVLKRKKYNF